MPRADYSIPAGITTCDVTLSKIRYRCESIVCPGELSDRAIYFRTEIEDSVY